MKAARPGSLAVRDPELPHQHPGAEVSSAVAQRPEHPHHRRRRHDGVGEIDEAARNIPPEILGVGGVAGIIVKWMCAGEGPNGTSAARASRAR